MKYLTVTSSLVAAILLSSCGVAYEQRRAEILKTASSESFGPPPPADYRSIGEAFIKRLLKDPDSAKFEWVGEPKHEAIQPAFVSPHATPVWVTVVRVNAKTALVDTQDSIHSRWRGKTEKSSPTTQPKRMVFGSIHNFPDSR